MHVLHRIEQTARLAPDRIAIRTGEEFLSYGDLWKYSGRLAAALRELLPQKDGARIPLAVYGHKSPWMLVAFLGCVRAGHGYCPLDTSLPASRIQDILDLLPEGIVLTTEPFPLKDMQGVRADQNGQCSPSPYPPGGQTGHFHSAKVAVDVMQLCLQGISPETTEGEAESGEPGRKALPSMGLNPVPDSWQAFGEDLFYMIFTSGSTGKPKGVQITEDCLAHFLDWSVNFGSEGRIREGSVFLNQAPFSFDLSVMDLYTCMAVGGTLVCLEKTVQADYRRLLEVLGTSGAQIWVSTPSFAEMCLADPSFRQELLPALEVFWFCGETLANKTALRLLERFPDAKVFNTYGPTESTVAVTGTEITREMALNPNPLPLGRPKSGTVVEIRDEQGNILPEGEKGEIVLIGDTVSKGYYRQEELTQKAFFLQGSRGYHTGDKGYLRDGLLYYCGRLDLQIKLHGYRMELEDIENNLMRLCTVKRAVVMPKERGGKIVSLTAYLVLRQDLGSCPSEEMLREEMEALLPAYMIPKKLVLVDTIPMTPNGKADRRKLEEMGKKA